MAQGERAGPGVRGAAARGVRRAWRPPRAVAAGRPPRSAVAAARRCRTDPSPDAPRWHRRPRSRGVGADPRRVRGAAAVARDRRRGRGDARCRHPGRAPGGTPRGAGTAARRGRVVGAPDRRGTRGGRRRPAHAARAAARRRRAGRRARCSRHRGLRPARRPPRRERPGRPGRRPLLRLGRRCRGAPVRDPDRHVQLDRAQLELPPDDPAFARLEAVYLGAWDGVASRADLQRAAAIARVLGCIGRALAWERSLSGLEDDEMDGFGDGVAGWLVEFAGRLGRLAATR